MISVVVPVYNVENYLCRCLDSILAQSYKDYEIILVDDGSTDNSGKICDEYAKKNKKVIVIHKTNGGLSDARNTGIKKAKGEFITYVDSDDWIHKDFLKNLYNLIIDKNADMAVSGIEFVYENQKEKINDFETIVDIYSGLEALEKMLHGNLADHGSSACGILYKTELSKKYEFPYKRYHEDDFTTFKYYIDSKKVAVTSQKMYFYLQRNNSIMHRKFGKSSVDELDAADSLYEGCSKLGKKYAKAAEVKKFGNYNQVFLENPDLKKVHKETYRRICKYFRMIKYKFFFGLHNSKRTRFYGLCMIIGGAEFYRVIRKII